MGSSTLILALFGLIVGSFLNVVSLRYDGEGRLFFVRRIGGRSHCPGCHRQLTWYELIPLISFCIQLGRCRGCHMRLSWQYPIIELASAAVFAGAPKLAASISQAYFIAAGGPLPFWYYLLTACFLIAGLTLLLIAAVDARLSIIPDQANVLIGVLGIITSFLAWKYGFFGMLEGSFIGHYSAIFGLRDSIVVNRLVAVVFSAAFYGLVWFLSRGRAMGFGDVKLAAALGLLLGWPDAVLAHFIAFIIGGIFGGILILRRVKGMKSAVPFGPFIVIGTLLVAAFGQQIMDGYFMLFP